MQNSNSINSKRFVVRKSLIGKNTTVNVEFKSGKTFKHFSKKKSRSDENFNKIGSSKLIASFPAVYARSKNFSYSYCN